MKLQTVGNGMYKVNAGFIASNPSKREVAEYLCRVANQHVLEVDDTYASGLAEQVGLTKDAFYDDTKETYERFGQEALEVYGIVNWKVKEDAEL